jgi:hypothetical protein
MASGNSRNVHVAARALAGRVSGRPRSSRCEVLALSDLLLSVDGAVPAQVPAPCAEFYALSAPSTASSTTATASISNIASGE